MSSRQSEYFNAQVDEETLRLTPGNRTSRRMPVTLRDVPDGVTRVVVHPPKSDGTIAVEPAPWPVALEFVVPGELNLELQVSGRNQFWKSWAGVTIAGEKKDRRAPVSVELVAGPEDDTDREEDHPPVRIHLVRADLRKLVASYRPIVVAADEVEVAGIDPPVEVEVGGTTAIQGHLSELRVLSDGARVSCASGGRIDRLVFGREVASAVLVSGGGRPSAPLRVQELASGGTAATLTLADVNLTLEAVTPSGGVTVAGAGANASVTIPQGAVVDGVTFTMPLSIAMHAGAVAHDVRGAVKVSAVEHAHLEGAKDEPLRLVSLSADRSETPFRLATVLNVELVPAHASIPLVAALEDSHRFTPALGPRPDFGSLSAPDAADMASHYDRLGDVARRRHAEGPVRSDIAWRSYRLREVAATDTTERRLLRAYRVLGYGQQWQEPLRALLVTALVATVAHQIALHGWSPNFSPAGIGRFLVAFATTALGPLNYARSAAGWFPDGLGGAIYSLLLVPTSVAFAALVLALRQYVRVKT